MEDTNMKELIVALDFPAPEQAIALARNLAGEVRWVKIGLELFCQGGPAIVQTMKDLGFKVFLDLKFMDIPNTVRGAVAAAARTGADMLTVHLFGGQDMIKAAREGLKESGVQTPPLLVGVTVLTSMEACDIAAPLALSTSIDTAAMVLNMSRQALEWGLDGVVCSGQEAAQVRDICPPPFRLVTPGIRMGQTSDDQKRVTTPAQAIARGSNFLVVGRPITRAEDPCAAAKIYLQEIA